MFSVSTVLKFSGLPSSLTVLSVKGLWHQWKGWASNPVGTFQKHASLTHIHYSQHCGLSTILRIQSELNPFLGQVTVSDHTEHVQQAVLTQTPHPLPETGDGTSHPSPHLPKPEVFAISVPTGDFSSCLVKETRNSSIGAPHLSPYPSLVCENGKNGMLENLKGMVLKVPKFPVARDMECIVMYI